MIRGAAFALAVVIPCSVEAVGFCAVDRTYDPHVAVILWSDGYREEVATINGNQCQCVRAEATPRPPHRAGLRIIESYCDHRNGFPPEWDVIRGYNDK
jgi:hypothetical protein